MIIIIALALLAESYIPLAPSKRRRSAATLEAVQAQYADGGEVPKHRAKHQRTYGSNAGESYCLGCRWYGAYDEFDAHIPDEETGGPA